MPSTRPDHSLTRSAHSHTWRWLALLLAISSSPHFRPHCRVLYRDAKLSVVEWNQGAHTLRTRSLHCWEGEGVAATALREGRQTFALPPRVVADPLGRWDEGDMDREGRPASKGEETVTGGMKLFALPHS